MAYRAPVMRFIEVFAMSHHSMGWHFSAAALALFAVSIAPLAMGQDETTGPAVTPEVAASILAAKPGDIVNMGDFLSEDYPRIPYTKQAGGPQMVFSDDPEYFRVPEGIGTREKVNPGRVRMYVYHVNGTTETARRITAVIDNLGDKPMSLRMLRYASEGPSKNYHAVGKGGILKFLKSQPARQARVIPPGESTALDPNLEDLAPEFDELVHGFYEFEIDQPARLTTLQTDMDTSGVVASARLTTPVQSARHSGAGRGYFPFSDYTVEGAETYDTSSGPAQLVVADGVDDRWITGHDFSTTMPAQNKGNYGVLYNISLDWTSADGRALALVVWNARSQSQWCGALAHAIGVSAGRHPAGIVEVPRDSLVIKGAPEAVVLQVFAPPRKGQTSKIELTYTPPGASCLPTPIVFVPVELPKSGTTRR